MRRLHEKLFYRPLLDAVAKLPSSAARLTPEAARARLEALGYRDPAGALRHIEALTSGLRRRAAIQRTLLPVLLGWFADAAEPDAGLLAFRQVSEALGDSPWFLRLLRDETKAAERMACVLASSRYATGLLLRAPEAVALFADDAELVPKPVDVLRAEMMAAARRQGGDAEQAAVAVRSLRRRELFRVAAADVLGLTGLAETGEALTAITTASLDAVLAATIAKVEMELRGPLPTRFAVIAMGRYGGHESGFGSDVDVIFVHEPGPGLGPDEDRRASDAAQAVGTELRRLLQIPAPDPPLVVDADLRPEGKQGPLVRSLGACEAYYARRAASWEWQALLRAEFAVGDAELGAKFIALADRYRYPAGGLSDQAAREIRRIKARVEAERIPRATDRALHLKLGPGGLSDVEWTVQLLQLQHGHAVPGLRTTRTLAALDAAVEAGLVQATDAGALRASWRFAARIRNAIMLVRGRPGDALPARHDELTAVARLLGYKRPATCPTVTSTTAPRPGPTRRRPHSRRTTAAPPDAPARSWSSCSTVNGQGAARECHARPLARSTRSASTVRKPRQSDSAAGDQDGQLNIQPPSSRCAPARWSRCASTVSASNSRRAIEPGSGAKSSGECVSPAASGSSATRPPRQQRPDPVERFLGAGAVGHLLEEREHAEHLVSVRLGQRGDPRPHDLGGAVKPGVGEAARVEQAGDLAGLDQRCPLGGYPPRGVRSLRDRRLNERRAALGRGDGRQPVDGVAYQPLVPRAGQVHDPQAHLHGGRLAGGRPAVRLERVAEPAVRVPVGGDRVPHRLGRAAPEQPLEYPAVEQPCPRGKEIRCRIEVWSLLHEAISPGTARRRLERNGHRWPGTGTRPRGRPGIGPASGQGPAARCTALARWPDARPQRVGRRVVVRGPPSRPDRCLPPDLRQDGHDDRLVGDGAVRGVQRPEHPLAARLADQVVEQPVVNLLAAGEPVVGGLGQRCHGGVAGRFAEQHQRRVLEVHAQMLRMASLNHGHQVGTGRLGAVRRVAYPLVRGMAAARRTARVGGVPVGQRHAGQRRARRPGAARRVQRPDLGARRRRLRRGAGHRAGPHRDRPWPGDCRCPLPAGRGRPGPRPAAQRAPRPARLPRRPASPRRPGR